MSDYRKLKKIGFQYSNDDEATWSTALVLECSYVDVWKETFTKVEQADATKREWETRVAYIMCDLKIDEDQFNPSEAGYTNQAANWLSLQNWCDGALRRIYNADVTNYPTFNSYTTFNAADNANYVNLPKMTVRHERQGDQNGATPDLKRWMQLNLKTRDKA